MTNEEAIRIAQGLITDFKCESETIVDFCNTIIKALEQEPVIDKIRAEIKTMAGDIETIADVLAIIDKYRAESEEQEMTFTIGKWENTIYFIPTIIWLSKSPKVLAFTWGKWYIRLDEVG